MPLSATPIEERLARHTEVSHTGCWLWTASKRPDGYGQIWTSSGGGKRKLLAAHRVSWETHRGPIPEGLDLDHLCRVRHCINPDHLEPVTRRENILRGEAPAAHNARRTHCADGHPLETMPGRHGRRGCPTCATRPVAASAS